MGVPIGNIHKHLDKQTQSTIVEEAMSDEIQDIQRQAFSSMLKAGQLPRPHSQADATALRKMGVRLRGYGLLLDASEGRLVPEG